MTEKECFGAAVVIAGLVVACTFGPILAGLVLIVVGGITLNRRDKK